jgi:hypothetical protein
MSLAAVTLVLAHVAMFGTAREADEGAAAHLWQLLIAAQIPIAAFFATKWLPREQRAAIVVLLLQVLGIIVALAPVFLLGL